MLFLAAYSSIILGSKTILGILHHIKYYCYDRIKMWNSARNQKGDRQMEALAVKSEFERRGSVFTDDHSLKTNFYL